MDTWIVHPGAWVMIEGVHEHRSCRANVRCGRGSPLSSSVQRQSERQRAVRCRGRTTHRRRSTPKKAKAQMWAVLGYTTPLSVHSRLSCAACARGSTGERARVARGETADARPERRTASRLALLFAHRCARSLPSPSALRNSAVGRRDGDGRGETPACAACGRWPVPGSRHAARALRVPYVRGLSALCTLVRGATLVHRMHFVPVRDSQFRMIFRELAPRERSAHTLPTPPSRTAHAASSASPALPLARRRAT